MEFIGMIAFILVMLAIVKFFELSAGAAVLIMGAVMVIGAIALLFSLGPKPR